ncbi:hypothetical protein QAD02_002773 [Eretmocerus hayati]|uniref:Uncharacterized protein n=1 Tax=Eretmocerus hayati TaxID=131215 RepID=A0ACC2NJT4_9HYME|nr:hypothetical protein QAD02_002773 [Eretmocerus hayati]
MGELQANIHSIDDSPIDLSIPSSGEDYIDLAHTLLSLRVKIRNATGQERFGNMTRVYYKEAVGAFIVFDVTRSTTLDAVMRWKLDLDSKVQLPDGSPLPCVLLGNKCDQPREGSVDFPHKMEEYCREWKFIQWFETSAKDNINIDEAAKFLIDEVC